MELQGPKRTATGLSATCISYQTNHQLFALTSCNPRPPNAPGPSLGTARPGSRFSTIQTAIRDQENNTPAASCCGSSAPSTRIPCSGSRQCTRSAPPTPQPAQTPSNCKCFNQPIKSIAQAAQSTQFHRTLTSVSCCCSIACTRTPRLQLKIRPRTAPATFLARHARAQDAKTYLACSLKIISAIPKHKSTAKRYGRNGSQANAHLGPVHDRVHATRAQQRPRLRARENELW